MYLAVTRKGFSSSSSPFDPVLRQAGGPGRGGYQWPPGGAILRDRRDCPELSDPIWPAPSLSWATRGSGSEAATGPLSTGRYSLKHFRIRGSLSICPNRRSVHLSIGEAAVRPEAPRLCPCCGICRVASPRPTCDALIFKQRVVGHTPKSSLPAWSQ